MSRGIMLHFRVDADEAAEILKRAGGKPMSQFLRESALGFSSGDPKQAVPADEVKGILKAPLPNEDPVPPKPKIHKAPEYEEPPKISKNQEYRARVNHLRFREGKTSRQAERQAKKELGL